MVERVELYESKADGFGVIMRTNVSSFFPEPRLCVVCHRRISSVSTGTFAVDRDLETLCISCAMQAELQLRARGLWGGSNVFTWYSSSGDLVDMETGGFGGSEVFFPEVN